ncbi:MAG: GntR family transcriptional regulator [Nakamurella sp.]
MFDDSAPIFAQISEQLADGIADGSLAEGERVPSSNELAVFHRINPATAAKGVATLVEVGLLEKRRGVGMFVVCGAREKVLQARRAEFDKNYVEPLVAEASRIGISIELLTTMITRAGSGVSNHHHDRGGTL